MKKYRLLFAILFLTLLSSCNQDPRYDAETISEFNHSKVEEIELEKEAIRVRLLFENLDIVDLAKSSSKDLGIQFLDNSGDFLFLPFQGYSIGNEIKSLFKLRDLLEVGEQIKLGALDVDNFIVLTDSRRILTYGDNKYGQLGNASYDSSYDTIQDITSYFNLVENEEPIMIEIYNNEASYAGAGLLTNLGRMFVWGSLNFQVDGEYYTNKPLEINDRFIFENGDESIKSFVLGGNQTMFVTNYNSVFGWGFSGGGGFNNTKPNALNYSNSFNISENEKIRFSYLNGLDDGIVITTNNRVFAWGNNYHEQIQPRISCFVNCYIGPTEITDQIGIEFLEGEYILRILPTGITNYIITSLGRIFLSGVGLTNPVGPKDFDIYSINNPYELEFVVDSKSSIGIFDGFIVVYGGDSLEVLVPSSDLREELEFKRVQLYNEELTDYVNIKDGFNPLAHFGLNDAIYVLISEELINEERVYYYRKFQR